MRKVALVALAALLVSSFCFAQVPRESSVATIVPTATFYTNIGATGLDAVGNPGFLILSGAASNPDSTRGETQINYFLWVDSTGDLRIASYSDIHSVASFPTGDWRLPYSGYGTVVGNQS